LQWLNSRGDEGASGSGAQVVVKGLQVDAALLDLARLAAEGVDGDSRPMSAKQVLSPARQLQL
jgi:hypothetical protein